MLPAMTVPTLIVSPRGRCVFFEEFGWLEPGGEGSVVVEAVGQGQVIRVSASEWKEYRKVSPGEGVFNLVVTARHESGHAIAAACVGLKVEQVSVFPESGKSGLSLGRMLLQEHAVEEPVIAEIARLGVIRLAGSAVDKRAGKGDFGGGERDQGEVAEALKKVFPRQARLRTTILNMLGNNTSDLVAPALPAIESLARMLSRKFALGEEDVQRAMGVLTQRRVRAIARIVEDTLAKLVWTPESRR